MSQQSALETLIVAMVEHGHPSRLCSFPFTGLQDAVDSILLHKAEQVVDIRPQANYHKILFSWRIQQGDYQGGKVPCECADRSCGDNVSTVADAAERVFHGRHCRDTGNFRGVSRGN
jgi:hypothetical protein